MPTQPERTDWTAADVGRRLLEPYTISERSPYLSDDQRRLSEMTLRERSAWMAEWLLWAQSTEHNEGE